jgi:hypothetical protein
VFFSGLCKDFAKKLDIFIGYAGDENDAASDMSAAILRY